MTPKTATTNASSTHCITSRLPRTCDLVARNRFGIAVPFNTHLLEGAGTTTDDWGSGFAAGKTVTVGRSVCTVGFQDGCDTAVK
jgi:hypothetical protein